MKHETTSEVTLKVSINHIKALLLAGLCLFACADDETDPGTAADPSLSVGESDDEIEEISDSIEGGDFFDSVFPFARAIEAKLKEKNACEHGVCSLQHIRPRL